MQNRLSYRVWLLLLAGVSYPPLALGQPPLVDAQRQPAGANVVPAAQARTADQPELFAGGNRVETPALPVADLLAQDAQAGFGPLRMGVVQDLEPGAAAGVWTPRADGSWLWTLAVQAGGAQAVRLRIREWPRPQEGELVIYDPASPQYALGPLDARFGIGARGRAAYWTPTVFGPQVHVEYYLGPGVTTVPPAEPPLTIDAVLNQYRALPAAGGGPTGEAPILPCHLDVTCHPAWQLCADGVGVLSFVSNQFGFFCSGAMFNRIPQDFTPLFATARHCGVDGSNDRSLLVTWFYQSQTCNGMDPPPLNSLPQTPGVVLLVDDPGTDYTLVGLAAANTGGVTYEGWNANYWDDDSAATGIHHADGSWKRITFGTKLDDVTSCVEGEAYQIENPDGQGEIEKGSSGSPIFDSAFRVRGTASCASWGCGVDDLAEYGRLDLAWWEMEPFLRPVNPIYVNGAWGGTERGTVSEPFRTVLEATFAVIKGSSVHIETGSYDEAFIITKPMTLRARNGLATIGR